MSPTLLALPAELHFKVLSFLTCADLHRLRLVNRHFAVTLPIARLRHEGVCIQKNAREEDDVDEDGDEDTEEYADEDNDEETDEDDEMNNGTCPIPCSMTCIRGLKNGLAMDKKCPNYLLHARHTEACKYPFHPISRENVLTKFSQKIAEADLASYRLQPRDATFIVAASAFKYGLHGHFDRTYDSGFMKKIDDAYEKLDDLQGYSVSVYLGYCMLQSTYVILTAYPDEPFDFEGADKKIQEASAKVQAAGVSTIVDILNFRTNPETGEAVFVWTGGLEPMSLGDAKAHSDCDDSNSNGGTLRTGQIEHIGSDVV